MSNIAIRVEGLGKQYRIGGPQAGYQTIRETLIEAAQAPFRRGGHGDERAARRMKIVERGESEGHYPEVRMPIHPLLESKDDPISYQAN